MRGSPIAVLLLASLAVGSALQLAEPCDLTKCQLPTCKCSTTDSGSGISVANIPQMVLITFDDAVTAQTYTFFEEALIGLKNPDGCSVGATHFVTHEYTDYSSVHNLWKNGHEIALHSVTHSTDQSYWKNIELATMEAEFGDMRKIIGHFAAIPESDVQGIRLPFLQYSGNTTLEAIQSLGLLYDSSLPTKQYLDPALWPYTFEYLTTQECEVPPCPDASFPGVWEVPMTDWVDQDGVVCNMVDACAGIPETEAEILEWMLEQFNRHYKGSRAPFPVFMHAAWFLRSEENFKAFKGFVNHLQTLSDVYIVTLNQAINWVKNPAPVTAAQPFGACQTKVATSQCVPKACGLESPLGGERWMTSCLTSCSTTYPWLGNPYGY